MEPVLEANGLTYGYTDRYFVKDLSMHFKKGEVVSIIGPNGSGKSTILRMLSRLLKPVEGVVLLEGKALDSLSSKEIATKMTMLPQIYDHKLDMTVRDLVKYGRQPHLKWYEEYSKKQEPYIDWALSVTSLTSMQHRPIHSLSGGERQRAWISMCIAQTPQILLLDEPTSYLDITHQLEVMELIKELNQSLQLTIIMVLHDLNQAARYSHRIIAIQNGKVVRQGSPVEVYTPELFRDVYGIEAKVYVKDGRPICDPYGLIREPQKQMNWSVD